MFKLTEIIINDALNNAHKILKEICPNYIEPNIYSIKLTNAHSYWANIGRCKKCPSAFGLHISRIFEQIENYDIAKNRLESCMIHEMIHTLPKCNNHGKTFQWICYKINKKYPQYKLQTSTSEEEVGLKNINRSTPKYKIVCKYCGHESYKYRKLKYDISKYECCYCNTSELMIINL